MPHFSVVIPTYNRAALLQVTLTSVFSQRLDDFEVIVVDDGSTDETPSILAARAERIRVVQQSGIGPGAARNCGAAVAIGSYLAFLDSDDLWFPWTLDVYAAVIATAHEPAFVAGKPFQFSDVAAAQQVTESRVAMNRFADYYASGDEWRWWGASSFVIRADAFRAVGGFTNERINGEDADLALRLGDAAGFVQVVSPPTFAYREHAAKLSAMTDRTVAGISYAVDAEHHARYPGGVTRAAERRQILTRHARPAILECLRSGRAADAWRLFRDTWTWHVRQGRWRFLFGFPLLAAAASLKRSPRT